MEGCPDCRIGIKHEHSPKGGDPELYRMLQRWLEWALDWGDRDMYQALVAETQKILLIHREQECPLVAARIMCSPCGYPPSECRFLSVEEYLREGGQNG